MCTNCHFLTIKPLSEPKNNEKEKNATFIIAISLFFIIFADKPLI